MKKITWILLILANHFVFSQTVTNGSVTGFPAGNNLVGPNAAGWTTCGFSPDLCSITFNSYVAGSQVTAVASPDGGTWLGLAGLSECSQTTITGLTVGSSYSLCFYGACFGTGTTIFNSTPAVPSICVGATCQTFTIPQAASVWSTYSMNFTATATSMVLSATLSQSGTYATSAYVSLDGFRVGSVGLCNKYNAFSDTICSGDTAMIHASGGATYSWRELGTSTVLSTNDTLFVSPTITKRYVIALDTFILDTVEVYVYRNVVADFTADTVCFGERTIFTNTTSGTIRSLLWDFGDGGTSIFRPDTSHLYNALGAYNVKLIVRNSAFCIDSITKQIIVLNKPTTDFSFTNVCENKSVNFTNTSSVTSGSIASLIWNWDLGNGATSAAQNTSTTYLTPGTYNVKLHAKTSIGCEDSIIKSIVIHPKPIANFKTDTVCFGNPTSFTDLSTGTVDNWTWPFSSTTTIQNPTHTFVSIGTFPIKLIARTDSGCIHDTTINVIVNPIPTADFNFSPQVLNIFNTNVCFTDKSTGGISYSWNFGFSGANGNSTIQSPCEVTFPNDNSGSYLVKLYASNQFGCIDSTTKVIKIADGFIFYIPSAFTPNLDGENDYFYGHTRGLSYFEFFIFNRWGEEVFHTKDQTEKWDGKYNSKYVQNGVYIYRAIIKNEEGETKEFVGHFSVIR